MTRARILLVEDVRLQQALAEELLVARGFAVVVAGSAAEAREALASRGPFDAVLVDLNLPDGAGSSLLAGLEPGLPVVAVTAQDTPEGLLRTQGFIGRIPKPLDTERFAAQVEAFLPPLPPRGGLLAGEDADTLSPLLADLFADFARALPGQLERLERLLAEARAAPEDAERRERVRTLAHQLRGSSGTYGFDAVGDACAQLDDVLEAFGASPPTPALWQALEGMVAEAKAALAEQAPPPVRGR
jgi:CheY-like chemotaxis protein